MLSEQVNQQAMITTGKPANFRWEPNGSGGVNYFLAKKPITNTEYGYFTGQDYGAIEKQVLSDYNRPSQESGNFPGSESTGNAGGSGSVGNALAVAQFDQGINTLNNGLNRLPGQLDVAKGNINTQYGTNRNELDSTKNQAQSSYTTSGNQNQQGFRTDKNAIADRSSLGLNGLMRMLGAYGAVGSDRGVASQAVATQASQERAGAGQVYAQNQSGLDTNWNNFLSQDENSRRKLEDWKTQQLNSAEAQSQTTKQDLLSKLADLAGQKSAAAGGSYAGSAQPYIDQANSLSASIDNLGRLNPTYTGVTPVYNAPSLSNYTVAQGAAPVAAKNATEQQVSPYLSILLAAQKEKEQAGL